MLPWYPTIPCAVSSTHPMLSCDLATAIAGSCCQSRHQCSRLSFGSPPRSCSLATFLKSENRGYVLRADLTGYRAMPASHEPKQAVSGMIHGARHDLEARVFKQSANRSPALSTSRVGMHIRSRSTCRTRIHSSAPATSTPPLVSVPTVPGGAPTGVPVISPSTRPRCVRGPSPACAFPNSVPAFAP